VAAQGKGNASVEPPSYLRTAQVADLLYVSPKTVSRWAKEGSCPSSRRSAATAAIPKPRSANWQRNFRGGHDLNRPVLQKLGRSGSRSATPRQALPDWGSDIRAGQQSNGAIFDDIDRRVQACSLDWCQRRSEKAASRSSPRPDCRDKLCD
jgi:hypothetical protein